MNLPLQFTSTAPAGTLNIGANGNNLSISDNHCSIG